MTEQKYETWIKEGRGQGEGKDYKPWLTIQDVPSNGVVSREQSWTVGRIHHLMSRLELSYFYVLDWSDIVVDIREQYPLLPIQRTIEISKDLGVAHPKDPETNEFTPLTTDFFLTISRDNNTSFIARTVKPASRLTKRTIEKFAIEKQYYDEQGIDWKIVTDKNLPKDLVQNIEWLHNAYNLDFAPDEIDYNILPQLADSLFNNLNSSYEPLSKITNTFDKRAGLSVGSSLFIVQHMLATKQWETDMFKKINPSKYIEIKRNDLIAIKDKLA